MDEDQFEALIDLIETISYKNAGDAVHQPRPQDNVRHSINMARLAFGLPPKENDDG